MAKPPRKIKMSSGHMPRPSHGSQSIRPGLGGSIHGSFGGGFGGFKMFPPSASRRPARGPYRASSGFGLGPLLVGSLLNGDNLESLAQGIGQALAGGLGGDIGEVPEDQKINTLAPAYPVECPHCGATIPAFVWVCEYCDSPRPVENDHEAE